jgi:hypothetical protein
MKVRYVAWVLCAALVPAGVYGQNAATHQRSKAIPLGESATFAVDVPVAKPTKANSPVILRLRDVTIPEGASGIRVYLNRPIDEPLGVRNSHYLTSFAPGQSSRDESVVKANFVIDVSNALKRDGETDLVSGRETVRVTIEPVLNARLSQVAPAAVTVGNIEILQ